MRVSVSRHLHQVGTYALPDATAPFPRLALQDFFNHYLSEIKRLTLWVKSHRRADPEGASETEEWVSELEEKAETLRKLLALDSETPRDRERIKKMYQEFVQHNPKG